MVTPFDLFSYLLNVHGALARGGVRGSGLEVADGDPQPVDNVTAASSNVYAGAYDPNTNKMYLQFHSGGIYEYDDVPVSFWNEYKAAGSKGRFVWTDIRNSTQTGADDRFRYRKVASVPATEAPLIRQTEEEYIAPFSLRRDVRNRRVQI